MIVEWLSVEDFRNHRATQLSLNAQLTLIVGPNGHGKTNLLEGIGLLDGSGSFRRANSDVLVRNGCARAYVRARVRRDHRNSMIEMEIASTGRSRTQLNGQRLRSQRDLADTLNTVVFCPTDLAIAAGGPSTRRDLLDNVLNGTDRSYRKTRIDMERILRQRNNLLKQAGHRPDEDSLTTLDVWDSQLALIGEIVSSQREALCQELTAPAQDAYSQLAGSDARLRLLYDSQWCADSLTTALAQARREDLRRGTTTVGPHRDDVLIHLDGLPVRTHASQGEQRSIALAIRLAQHRYISRVSGSVPVILLDDVFSELDSGRAARLVTCLPAAQTVMTSATGHMPSMFEEYSAVEVRNGQVI